jgi:hypothetical protein
MALAQLAGYAAAVALSALTPPALAPGLRPSVSITHQPLSLVVRPARGYLDLRAGPHGRVLSRIGRRTILGSPQALSVVARRGSWLAVTSEALHNGQLGWVDARTVGTAVRAAAVDVDLSRRRLTVYDWGRRVRAIRVGIGGHDTPTPVGRFAITDKFPGESVGASYGCCVLVLSAHQPRPPRGSTPGVDFRIAIHGGGGVGASISAGCLRASDPSLRFLMRVLPLGTPVFVHR